MKSRKVSLIALLMALSCPLLAQGAPEAPDGQQVAALSRQADLAMRKRQYREAARLLTELVGLAPDFESGRACGRLARAGLLGMQAHEALEALEPLRGSWQDDSYACQQVALCEYAVAAYNKDTRNLERLVRAAFCGPSSEYPTEAPEIVAVAKAITAKHASDRQRATAAYDLVRTRVRYDKSLIPLGRQSVLLTLASGRAVCTGFAQLYLTLCRACGVPARLVAGEGRVGFHNWAEVWLDGGWVPVDPTRGRRRARFGHLERDIRAYSNQRENW